MKKNMEHFKIELKIVADKIAEVEERCKQIEDEDRIDMPNTVYAEYDKLSNELAALKERQNQILMLIHAN